MIDRRLWFMIVIIGGGGTALLLSMIFQYVPTGADFVDPLGRPSALADSIIYSTGQFDRVTENLVPKQRELARRISVLGMVSDSLDVVVDRAGSLTPLAGQVNSGTAAVVSAGEPLPGLLAIITGRATQAAGVSRSLKSTVGRLDIGLGVIGDRLGRVDDSLKQLGPDADSIAATLAQIRSESQRLAPASPVLGIARRLLLH